MLASRILLHCISVVFGYARALASVQLCPPVSNRPIGEILAGTPPRTILMIRSTQVLDLDRCVESSSEKICNVETHAHRTTYLGSDREKTFGPTITGLIHQHIGPERLLLWDSKLRGGRPDTMKILKDTYDAWGAEGEWRCLSWARPRADTRRRHVLSVYPLQLCSSRRTLALIQRSCRAAKKQAYLHSARCGIS